MYAHGFTRTESFENGAWACPERKLSIHGSSEFGQGREVSVVELESPQQFPDPFAGIELRAVGRQKVKTKPRLVDAPPLRVQGCVMVFRIVGDDDHAPTSRRTNPVPMAEGVYLQQEGMLCTFTKWNWEHPSLIGMLGMLPGDGVDPVVMKATVKKTMAEWKWDRCWGWDFPMMAMAAARNGEPALAVDALLNSSKKNGFNDAGLSTGGPFPYFPSNGGLLYAIALMAAGWDPAPSKDSAGTSGAPQRNAPGFPDDGSWSVKWEGLKPAL